MAFVGANYKNWLENYKIVPVAVFVRDAWGIDVKFWTFERGGLISSMLEQVGMGDQILVTFWWCNNWISPYIGFAYRIKIEIKPKEAW